MRELADLDALSGLKRLTHLILLENPVVGKEVSELQARGAYQRSCTRACKSAIRSSC